MERQRGGTGEKIRAGMGRAGEDRERGAWKGGAGSHYLDGGGVSRGGKASKQRHGRGRRSGWG